MAKKKFYCHPTAEVSEKAKIGSGTKIWHQAQVRENAVIGKNCVIGKSVYIDFGVRIGNRVKIQNHVSVYHGVTIEDDVILAPNATFTNDRYPRAFLNEWTVSPTLIKKGASICANATIVCGVTVGSYAMVGAGAVVTSDVPDYALVFGNPARIRGFVCKNAHKLIEDKSRKSPKGKIRMVCPHCKKKILIPEKDFKLMISI